MKRMIESLTGNYSASATIVDGTLILSLPDAVTPVVWRLELGQARASALEVRTGENGLYTLLLKTPRGDVNDIAAFDSRGRAVAALMSVTRAMEQSHGHSRPAANDSDDYNPTHLPVPLRGQRARTHHTRPRGGRSWLGALFAVALIVGLGAILLNLAPKTMTPVSTAQTPASGDAATQAGGVAVSADDFLKNR